MARESVLLTYPGPESLNQGQADAGAFSEFTLHGQLHANIPTCGDAEIICGGRVASRHHIESSPLRPMSKEWQSISSAVSVVQGLSRTLLLESRP